MSNQAQTATSQSTALFWSVQALICAAIVFAGYTVRQSVNSVTNVPRLNNEPRLIRPLHNYSMVVSDGDLKQILDKMRPTFPSRPPKTNFVDHGLRMWGSQIEFESVSQSRPGPRALSGQQMRLLLLDDNEFVRHWGKSTPALLEESEGGIRVRTQEGRATVSHIDHLVGTLAETGTKLNFPVKLRHRDGVFRELVEHAFDSFDLNQKEYEWTALAWALYGKDASSWFTAAGQEVTYDRLVERMMRQGQPEGVCYGQHRLYSLAAILRVDQENREQGAMGLLSETGRTKVIEYLKQMTARLYRGQSPEGYWDANWPDPTKPVSDVGTAAISRRVLATGHTLEWWAIAPEEVLPPRETVIRAGQWLSNAILVMDDREIERNYTFLTHAARALSLWRGQFPDEAEMAFREKLPMQTARNPADRATIQ